MPSPHMNLVEPKAMKEVRGKSAWQPATLRISVTDRCFLRCRYCMPDNPQFVGHDKILRFGQMLAVVDALRPYGLQRVRVTGGEPLVRRGIEWLFRDLSTRTWLRRVGMTTNGYLLDSFAGRLYEAGLRKINVSLDSVDPQRYEYLTRRPFLHKVLQGIDHALDLGYSVKINSVLIRGVNDQDLIPLVEWAGSLGVEIRFIEYMPFGDDWDRKKVVTSAQTLEQLGRTGSVTALGEENAHTRRYRLDTSTGSVVVGLIPAVSQPFCDRCDRLRLTATGDLMSCMFDRQPINIFREVVERDQQGLLDKIDRALGRKPAYLSDFVKQEKVVGLHSVGG